MYTNGQTKNQAKEYSGEATQNKKKARRMRVSENGPKTKSVAYIMKYAM